MASKARHTDRRTDALSRERIVATAVELLDAAGADGLTFRALSAELRTGAGAIYWHVANKSELLGAATDAVLAGATTVAEATPEAEVRALALGLFDAIDEHPWLAGQLAQGPWKSEALRIFERLGQRVQALGVPGPAQFTSATALMLFIVGAASQNAANAANAAELRRAQPDASRTALLAGESTMWEGLDPGDYPFLHDIAGQLREHDDREQFLAGVDLILAGIAALRPQA
ncbi:TetR/AcrR family transcriptional regulator [Paractinoplanes toevensis]|uniref:TetR family transcriptional regulator n=1 Tax=Paractinoplanes toevensis TaxID=571911 RepID=A0A919T7J2_9ACTN|nr:TetR/AcrR family transcriptional regulator C-terminal domain-containing protein [Actinoplanes toevensis]GIM90593.1 TetR family transcriptional regulator [Actinoplanes toevensis]